MTKHEKASSLESEWLVVVAEPESTLLKPNEQRQRNKNESGEVGCVSNLKFRWRGNVRRDRERKRGKKKQGGGA